MFDASVGEGLLVDAEQAALEVVQGLDVFLHALQVFAALDVAVQVAFESKI